VKKSSEFGKTTEKKEKKRKERQIFNRRRCSLERPHVSIKDLYYSVTPLSLGKVWKEPPGKYRFKYFATG